jgi:type VI secretion system protein ImpC
MNDCFTNPQHGPTVTEILSARLPYLLAACRFAQTLQSIATAASAMFDGPRHMQDSLNRWLSDYLQAERGDITEAGSAERPLGLAEVRLGDPFDVPAPYHSRHHYLAAELWIKPCHQLEGLTAPLRLKTRLPHPRR